MSDAWIDKVAEKIKLNDLDLYNKIKSAQLNMKLRKTVSAVKRTEPGRGSIITIRVN